jgi:hypothetical protein
LSEPRVTYCDVWSIPYVIVQPKDYPAASMGEGIFVTREMIESCYPPAKPDVQEDHYGRE